jgi:hypothetical protein
MGKVHSPEVAKVNISEFILPALVPCGSGEKLERERERERERKGGREEGRKGGMEGRRQVFVCVCACVKAREIEIKNERQR